MKVPGRLPVLLAVVALAGCGVETATTAATSAAIKQQEVDQGKKTLERAREMAEKAAQQVQQQAQKAGETGER